MLCGHEGRRGLGFAWIPSRRCPVAEQWIVATLMSFDLNVTACGPYRSREKAEEVARKIMEAGAWSEDDPLSATVIPQVVVLDTAAEVVAEAKRMGPS